MLLTMAKYHRWAYERLYEILENLDDQSYYADKSLFFKSIHGTLNHLYLVDQLWLTRFKGETSNLTQLNAELIHDRHELKKQILQQAEAWVNFIETFLAGPKQEIFTYNNIRNEVKSVPYIKTLTHVFNHGTHHRGQISTVLTQLKYPSPEMDLLYFSE